MNPQRTDSTLADPTVADPTLAGPAPAQPRRRLGLPVTVGLVFGALGLALTVIGIARGQVPFAPLNVAVALLIGGGVWFVVAWAVTTAATDVERDLEGDLEGEAQSKEFR